jgi:hypothetical protein
VSNGMWVQLSELSDGPFLLIVTALIIGAVALLDILFRWLF